MLKKIVLRFTNKNEESREKAKEKAREESIRKYYELRGALIKFYEDLDQSSGVVDVPAFKRADEMLRIIIKDDKDIDFYYNKLEQHNLVA